MAIAKQTAGVTFGYKPKVKQVERRKPTLLQRIVATCIVNAREMREFVADEIVYETMDTIRLLRYLRYEFGWAEGRRRTDGRRVTDDERRMISDERRMTDDERRKIADGRIVGLSVDGI